MAINKKENTEVIENKVETVAVDNNALQEKVDKLSLLVEQLLLANSQLNQTKVAPIVEPKDDYCEEDDFKTIPLAKPIRVISLCYGQLNLRTSAEGSAKIFTFDSYGTSRTILYQDLMDIVSCQNRFAREGYFMILDKDVVKQHYLEEHYNKFLDKKQIDHILENDDNTMTSLFKNTTPKIQKTIVDIIFHKILDGEFVDRNKVKIISDLYGTDIFGEADKRSGLAKQN